MEDEYFKELGAVITKALHVEPEIGLGYAYQVGATPEYSDDGDLVIRNEDGEIDAVVEADQLGDFVRS